MEGSRVEALPAVLVKVAAAIVAAPGDVILRPLPALTVVSAVANLAASLLAATNVWISASDLILLSTTRTKVTTAPLRAAEDVMATPDLYTRNGAAICGTHHVQVAVAPFSTVQVYAHSMFPLVFPVYCAAVRLAKVYF